MRKSLYIFGPIFDDGMKRRTQPVTIRKISWAPEVGVVRTSPFSNVYKVKYLLNVFWIYFSDLRILENFLFIISMFLSYYEPILFAN